MQVDPVLYAAIRTATAKVVDFVVVNLLWEVPFLILVVFYNYLLDVFFRAPRIVRKLSLHNSPSRNWRKGIYARDRFMTIYESETPLSSSGERMYGNGMEGAVWPNSYIDKYLLQEYKLVQVFEEHGQTRVKPIKNRLSRLVYQSVRKSEQKEIKCLERFEKSRKKPSWS